MEPISSYSLHEVLERWPPAGMPQLSLKLRLTFSLFASLGHVNLKAMLKRTLNTIRYTQKAKRSLLFVICQLSFALFLSGCSAVGTNKPAALQVTTTPEASVFLDGKHLGKTPFFSDQLKAGDFLLKISVSEATYVERIKLVPGSLTVVNRELNKNEQAGSGETLWLEDGQTGLFISSLPPETDVTIDGQLKGKTPLLISEIEPGEHKIILSKQGYSDRQFAIRTSKDSRLMANVSLASQLSKSATTLPSPIPITSKVEILPTPQGFLRVREQASTNSKEIGRLKAKEQVNLLQETKDWFKIEFEGKQGWISSQYAKKL